ncbi:MAG: hypothetical protein H7A49_10700 [Akkermansiaceae bacterium]|nr:hypothetical protein [Akkermansiaceae bacterium]MCP5544358.1 hypothetical protein [Akkermansiaceae bacterium]MCP5547424.1 hypothetical protein [Akkermansiaceae bacterium]
MTRREFRRNLKRFPDEATLLHCLRQIGIHRANWVGDLLADLDAPDFDLESYFCQDDANGNYLSEVKVSGDRLAFDFGDCYGGECGSGNRYVFRLPEYELDEEETPQTGWIH